MHELKRPLSYEDQISRLQNEHNLIIGDKENAIRILSHVNYYRLSGYGIGLKMKDDPERYRDGITIEHIYRLYEFDRLFRNLLFGAIERIEIQLRTQIAYQLSLKYGAEGYLNPDNFDDKTKKDGESVHLFIIENFTKEAERQRNTPFVKHHRNKYDGHFPLWVAVELLTFGNLSSMFSIMKTSDKKAIADLYDTEPKYLGSWLLALVEVRNICAHYGRLYNMPLKQRPRLYSEHKDCQNGQQNKIFPLLIVMRRMLSNTAVWSQYSSYIEDLIERYADVVNLSFIGFPKDWKTIIN